MFIEKSKYTAAAALLACLVTASPGVQAAEKTEEKTAEYVFDPVLVTAQRYEKSDLETPASTQVLTAEKLQATGANNLQEALKYAVGITYHAQGPDGQSYNTMTSKIMIRGVERGTLVLLNGVPINMNGRYNLEDIPVNIIEKVEIIRGGGSVLYGSEATGGVINIITKKTRANSVDVSAGSDDRQQHSLSVQADQFGLTASYKKLGYLDQVSGPYSSTGTNYKYNDFNGSEKTNVSWDYAFSDSLRLTHIYAKGSYGYTYRPLANPATFDYMKDYEDEKHYLQLAYEGKDGLQGKLYWNQKAVTGDKYNSASVLTERADTEDRVLGLDLSKKWTVGENRVVAGLDYQKERYYDDSRTKLNTTPVESITGPYSRDHYSLFGQWERDMNKATTVTLSARQDWVRGDQESAFGSDFSQFNPQLQVLTRLDAETSWYASAGRSFMMPTLAQMYGYGDNVQADSQLRPQKGMNYETGLKRNTGAHSWKLAVFKYDIEDYISFTETAKGSKIYKAQNEDVRNTGVELSCDVAMGGGWNGNWSVSYGNPEHKESGSDWERQYGRLQLTSGVSYASDKWNAALTASYLGKRVDGNEESRKPMLLTGLDVRRKLDAQREIYLNVDNVFDRRDIVSHASSEYYAMPRTFRLGYRMSF